MSQKQKKSQSLIHQVSDSDIMIGGVQEQEWKGSQSLIHQVSDSDCVERKSMADLFGLNPLFIRSQIQML